MQLQLAVLGVLLGASWAPVLSFEATEEMELGMTSKVGEGGRGGKGGHQEGAEQSWKGSWPRPRGGGSRTEPNH